MRTATRRNRTKAAPKPRSAELQVGTRCKVWDEPEYGPVVITRPFGLHPVIGKGLRLGYVAADSNGREEFFGAGKLVAHDAPRNYSHLVLAVDNKGAR